MKKITFLLFSLVYFCTQNLSAQKELEYITPPNIQHQDYSISIDNIVSKEDYCKFRLIVNNKTNDYQAFDLSKVGFIYENIGTYYPKKGKMKIIPPNEKISHTIRIDGNMNYMVEQFKVSLEGLFYASNGTALAIDSRKLEAGMAIENKEIQLEIKKVNNKRGRFAFAMNGTCNAGRDIFFTIDPAELKAIDEQQQSIKVDVGNEKLLELQDGKNFGINGDFESEGTTLMLDWTGVIRRYTLNQQAKMIVPIYHTVPAPAVTTTETASNNIQNTSPRPAAQNNCSKYEGPMNGHPVKVVIYTEEGECFQIKALGEYINPNYASKVSFGFPVMGKIEIAMENGETFNKNIVLNDDIYAVTYKIKKNNKGKYVTKMLLGTVGSTGPTAQELANQSAANLEKFKREQEQKSKDQLAEHRRRIAELDAKIGTTTEENTNTSSQTTTITNNNSTSNNNSTNRKMPNSMHLRFMEGATPLANMRVEVSTVSGWTGSGTTDSNGDVYIDATNLNTKNINIYAKNSNAEYKLGNVVKLDDNLFALIEPATLMLKTTNNLIKAAESGDDDAILKEMGW